MKSADLILQRKIGKRLLMKQLLRIKVKNLEEIKFKGEEVIIRPKCGI